MLRVVCLALIVTGGVCVGVSTWRYSRMVKENHDALYTGRKGAGVPEKLVFLALAFCVLGYCVGAADVLRRDVEPIYLFVSVVFFVGGLLFTLLIHAQIGMAKALREKAVEVMRSFVTSIEMKDPYTKGHSWHVYHLVQLFCEALPPVLRGQLNEPKLLDAALLHDIGKMGVPDEVLKKTGPLSDGEWVAIRAHTSYGETMLAGTSLREISLWVKYHHERLDGAGYHGVAGENIPLEARIIAVADTYSAITTHRGYRRRRSHSDALRVLQEVAGSQLDAGLVAVFCTIGQDVLEAVNPENLAEKSLTTG